MSGTALTQQRDLFTRLVTLGEEVTDALDHTNVVSTLGEEELNRAIAAIGDRALPDAATSALAALAATVERVIAANDPHRAIDWIGMQPRLALTLLAATLNPVSLPKDVVPPSSGSTVAARIPAGISFSDAPRDGRAVVYSGIQADPILRPLAVAIANATPAERLVARAVMNGVGSGDLTNFGQVSKGPTIYARVKLNTMITISATYTKTAGSSPCNRFSDLFTC